MTICEYGNKNSPDHFSWSFFPVPVTSDSLSMDIQPQGVAAGVDLLTHCDFGSDVESEIDGPEMGGSSSRREREGEREPDMSTTATQSWGDVFLGDTALDRYRERRAALARLRGEMEVVSRGGGGSEGGGPGAGGV